MSVPSHLTGTVQRTAAGAPTRPAEAFDHSRHTHSTFKLERLPSSFIIRILIYAPTHLLVAARLYDTLRGSPRQPGLRVAALGNRLIVSRPGLASARQRTATSERRQNSPPPRSAVSPPLPWMASPARLIGLLF